MLSLMDALMTSLKCGLVAFSGSEWFSEHLGKMGGILEYPSIAPVNSEHISL